MTSLKTIKIQLECSICAEALKCDDELTIIEPCNHHFHDSCLKTWLQTKAECPMCRLKILSDYEKCQILKMCVINRICCWFETDTQYNEALPELLEMMQEFNIDEHGFDMTDETSLQTRAKILDTAHEIRDQIIRRFNLSPYVKILDHPLVNVYNNKVYSYTPITTIIRRHPKPVGLVGGLINMGKTLLRMEH